MKLQFVLLLGLGLANALNIQSIDIGGSMGKDDETPIEEGNSFQLKCTLSGDDDWIHCGWSHVIRDEVGSDGAEAKVYCASSGSSDNGNTCEDKGNVDDSYASRITMDVSSSSCGIRINDADPRDNGDWECHVAGVSSGGQDFRSIEVFVSNQSSLVFKEPDLEDDDSQVLVYDLADNRPEIEATCRAYGGIPEPSFIWYIVDDRTEIETEDYDTSIKRGTDSRYGDYIEETITWNPTLDDLCEKYDLQEEICESEKNRKKERYQEFNFNLMCQADQGNYYQDENEADRIEVIVEVTNSAVGLAAGKLAAFSIILSSVYGKMF